MFSPRVWSIKERWEDERVERKPHLFCQVNPPCLSKRSTYSKVTLTNQGMMETMNPGLPLCTVEQEESLVGKLFSSAYKSIFHAVARVSWKRRRRGLVKINCSVCVHVCEGTWSRGSAMTYWLLFCIIPTVILLWVSMIFRSQTGNGRLHLWIMKELCRQWSHKVNTQYLFTLLLYIFLKSCIMQ